MVSSVTRSLGYNYKAVDIDLGEIFLKFPLHPQLQPYSCMDPTLFKPDIVSNISYFKYPAEKWLLLMNTMDWMGLKTSPEWACRSYYFAEEFVREDESCINNLSRWNRVILNLIRNSNYNPALPNFTKWNDKYQQMVGDIKAYVNDIRALE